MDYVHTTNDDLRDHFGPHPMLGTLDAYQWILLISAHSERHTKQIEEVKADPNFPRSKLILSESREAQHADVTLNQVGIP